MVRYKIPKALQDLMVEATSLTTGSNKLRDVFWDGVLVLHPELKYQRLSYSFETGDVLIAED